MDERGLWIRFKQYLHDISEGKKSIDEVITITLNELDRLDRKKSDASLESRVTSVSHDEDLR